MIGVTEFARLAEGFFPQAFLVFFALVIGHAIADFPLQGPFLAAAKNRHIRMPDPEGEPFPPNLWVYALTAHSLIHAAPVWLVTGSAVFALAEVVLHWLIDWAKCEGWTRFAHDQFLHVACKLIYAVLLFFGLSFG